MTFQFVCSECGKLLRTVTIQEYMESCHHTNADKMTFLEYIIDEIGGACPFCGHKLTIPPIDVEVTAMEVSKQ